ncbi:bifunctional precorrin-2 dehydrogenase/sirohydrochlorin ferrochelatase [Staphylococcus agnetis]|uniref:precorrin-2 dehydrogenase/sirohydrochlorin ferrochelatase family protein n=1 Tax=Staphylococcus agnetis TaxID=985762 RepID=UPI0021CE0687|nr:bifunctional precorrin-2 dehydrogenase/sirohydrochlorin ferrochelatase [Staphylococcus agnetis]UXU55406.1 bifunctional precorrin-2 dehydrogenase/sirohydrochlorin ferrochelatase [Staphylococcus agnetis]UXU64656.1 bifunctional precorrin-2 dehydrogenase/sirohydrochlorin ferrochelatase [Staphylococcus agnetis]UXU66998.1 bifunctional precorrin-2 dehydrogenase/sirohydrochlorin ferrochelatase [Staphylococcus agnetis]
MYPIQLNLAGKHVVIVGGGKIAWRKFSKLVTEPCSIDIVSPKFHDAFEMLQPSERLRLIREPYHKAHLKHADLIIIATNDPQTNNQVALDALPSQWINHTGDQTQSDFFNMLTIEHQDLIIGVSSNGQNIERTKRYAAKIKTFLAADEEDMHE